MWQWLLFLKYTDSGIQGKRSIKNDDDDDNSYHYFCCKESISKVSPLREAHCLTWIFSV